MRELAVTSVARPKQTKPKSIRFVSLLATRGPENSPAHDSDVPVCTAAIARQLNDHGCIAAGLGDAGDRWLTTK